MGKQWIEAFRIGGKASRGIKPEHLAEVVDDDFDANPRALCFGHPKDNTPAAGTISGAKLDGNSLLVEVASLTGDAIEGIKSGKWLNRSAAFFDPHHEANPRPGKWTLRHVGLLGASAPGIPNMPSLKQSLAFSAEGDDLDHLEVTGDPADAVIYAAPPTPIHYVFDAKEQTMDPKEKTPEMLAFEARESEFSARMKRRFEAGNNSAIDALVREGKVLPAEAAGLKTAFNALDPEADEVEFTAGDKTVKQTAVDHLLAFMAGLGKRVPINERLSPEGERGSENEFTSASAFNAAVDKLVKDEGISVAEAEERLAK